MSWTEDALMYLEKNRDYVKRDLEALRSGRIRISDAGADSTAAWTGRYERQIEHLDKIIQAYGKS